MTSRAQGILGRFPAHLEATRPGKQLETVTSALALDLDVLALDLAAVRRSHRLGNADTRVDVSRLGALHGISSDDLAVLLLRVEGVRALASQVAGASGPELEEGIRTLANGFAVAWDSLLPPVPDGADLPLPSLLYEPGPDGSPDAPRALRRFLNHLRHSLRDRVVIDLLRRRVATVCRIHAVGNGTVRALMEAAANALDLDLDGGANREAISRRTDGNGPGDPTLLHSLDGFWHASFATCRVGLTRDVPPELGAPVETDGPTASREKVVRITREDGRISLGELARQMEMRAATALARGVGAGMAGLTLGGSLSPIETANLASLFGYSVLQTLPVLREIVGIEENPLLDKCEGPHPRSHGGRFTLKRRGFGISRLRVQVTGVENRTVGPLLVNRDVGAGVGFAGTIPDGQVLEFGEEGRVTLEGVDVTPLAYFFAGAVFADAAERRDRDDFHFDGPGNSNRAAVFTVATPLGALDREALLPSAGNPVGALPLGTGETRFSFFTHVAYLGTRMAAPPPESRTVTPRPFIAIAGDSVFAGTPLTTSAASANVTLRWREHEGYALRVIIPQRFEVLSSPTADVRELVKAALARVRPAGVELRVDYLDESWRLGVGMLPTADASDPLNRLRGGTVISAVLPPP